jgi:hypothetical protein
MKSSRQWADGRRRLKYSVIPNRTFVGVNDRSAERYCPLPSAHRLLL